MKSLGIVAVTSVFIGMVMAVQFAFGLRKFGGMEYTGRVVALSFARELAPTLTAVIVGGRIGAGMAAEVGSMSVTEQIDAVRALGADPLKKLVWPRLVACVIVMPVLASFALVLGFSGAMVITDIQFNIPSSFFFRSALGTVTMMDFVSGMFKTPVFGAIIALGRLPFRHDHPRRRDQRRQLHHANRGRDFDRDSDCGLLSDQAQHRAVSNGLTPWRNTARSTGDCSCIPLSLCRPLAFARLRERRGPAAALRAPADRRS